MQILDCWLEPEDADLDKSGVQPSAIVQVGLGCCVCGGDFFGGVA